MKHEEIIEAASAYRNSVIEQDKADGYSRENLCYVDVKRAFIDGAEWCFETIKSNCTPSLGIEPKIQIDEFVSFIHDFISETNRSPAIEDFILWQRDKDIKKACEWIKNNTPIGLMEDEVIDFIKDFRKAMEE